MVAFFHNIIILLGPDDSILTLKSRIKLGMDSKGGIIFTNFIFSDVEKTFFNQLLN